MDGVCASNAWSSHDECGNASMPSDGGSSDPNSGETTDAATADDDDDDDDDDDEDNDSCCCSCCRSNRRRRRCRCKKESIPPPPPLPSTATILDPRPEFKPPPPADGLLWNLKLFIVTPSHTNALLIPIFNQNTTQRPVLHTN